MCLWCILNAPGLGCLRLHRFPRRVTVLFHHSQGLWPNSRNCEVRWRERYKPLPHPGEGKSVVRHGGSALLRRAAEDLCARKAGWPVLLCSGSSRRVTAPMDARGWERAAHSPVPPHAWSSHAALEHCRTDLRSLAGIFSTAYWDSQRTPRTFYLPPSVQYIAQGKEGGLQSNSPSHFVADRNERSMSIVSYLQCPGTQKAFI